MSSDQVGQPTDQPPTQPTVVTVAHPSMSATAVTGFVLALVALVLSWIPLVNNVSGFALAPLAVLFSLIGIVRASKGVRRGRGLAIAGLLLGVASFAIVMVTQQALSNAFDDAFDAGVEQGAAAGTQDDPLPFDTPVTFKSGLEVVVSTPSAFEPGDTAFSDIEDGQSHVFTVSVTNVGDEDKTIMGAIDAWAADGGQCARVFDSAQLNGELNGSLPVGKSVSGDVAFTCSDEGSIEVNMTPDMFTDKVWFAAR